MLIKKQKINKRVVKKNIKNCQKMKNKKLQKVNKKNTVKSDS